MKTFEELYRDLLEMKVSLEEPLPDGYDPYHLDCCIQKSMHPSFRSVHVSSVPMTERVRTVVSLMRLRGMHPGNYGSIPLFVLAVRHVSKPVRIITLLLGRMCCRL